MSAPLTDQQLVEMIRRRIEAFVALHGVRPSYVQVASGIGGEGIKEVDGLPVIRTSTYGAGSPMGIEVGLAQHHDIMRWTYVPELRPSSPSPCLYAISGDHQWVPRIEWMCPDHP